MPLDSRNIDIIYTLYYKVIVTNIAFKALKKSPKNKLLLSKLTLKIQLSRLLNFYSGIKSCVLIIRDYLKSIFQYHYHLEIIWYKL